MIAEQTSSYRTGKTASSGTIWWPSLAAVLRIHRLMMVAEGRTAQHCDEGKLGAALVRA